MKFKWTKTEQDNFEEIKRIVAHDTLLAYPDFNEKIKIHTDASKVQLGAVIIQNDKPIDLYCKKITYPHKRYTVA